jgi:hypothetical protein
MSADQPPTMNRRRLGATVLSLFALSAMRTDRRATIHDFDFTRFIADRASAAAVGAAYLRNHPDQASRDVLLGLLALPDKLLTEAQIAVAIERQIRNDFAHHRTVLLERWLVSRTEAVVCGLIALD